jgi:L-lactate dehydrogenase complex protein LldG
MRSREFVLANVRRNQPAAAPLPPLPAFQRPPVDLPVAFGDALERMGGRLALAPVGVPLDEFVRSLFPQASVICSATGEVHGTFSVADVRREPDGRTYHARVAFRA